MNLKKCELDIFPTPISVYDLSEVNIEVDDFYSSIQKEESHEHLLLNGGKSSYGTNQHILDVQIFSNLKNAIQECLYDYCTRLGIYKVEISNSWFSLTNKNGSLNLHRHEGSVVSGAFYPKIENSIAPLRFRNPLTPYKMNELYENVDSFYAVQKNLIDPHEGMLILFPSWLEHDTDKEIGERIVISFNSFYES